MTKIPLGDVSVESEDVKNEILNDVKNGSIQSLSQPSNGQSNFYFYVPKISVE